MTLAAEKIAWMRMAGIPGFAIKLFIMPDVRKYDRVGAPLVVV